MARSAGTFLMFQDGHAEDAMNFYVSLFPGGSIERVTRYGPGMSGPEGKVMLAQFTVAGQSFYCSDSSVRHAFDFTPSISIFIECTSEAELREAFRRLGEGGEELMELNNYGFSKLFGWVQDRYQVTWQLNLSD